MWPNKPHAQEQKFCISGETSCIVTVKAQGGICWHHHHSWFSWEPEKGRGGKACVLGSWEAMGAVWVPVGRPGRGR